MTDFFARVRSIVRSEEKKVRAAHIKAQSPPPTRAAASPREDSGPHVDDGSAAKIQLVKSASDVSIEDDKKKKKTSKSSSEDGSVKSSKSKDKDKKEKSSKKTMSKSSSHKKLTKKTATALPPPEVFMDSLVSLKTGKISVRGQVWLLRMKASREQMEQRKTTTYASLKSQPVSAEFTEQIAKDIDRTFPQYDLFQQKEIQNVMSDILRSVAAYRSDLGYCQGMNYVAGFLNTLMPEEDTFWLMVRIIDQFNMKDFWSGTLSGLPRSFFILEKLMESEIPRLFAHFNKVELVTSMYATPWMMTLFLYNHSIPFSTRLWDMLLFEGWSYVYAIALSILMLHEEQMLKMDFDELVKFLQFSCKKLESEPEVEQVLRLSSRIRETVAVSVPIYEKEYITMMAAPVS